MDKKEISKSIDKIADALESGKFDSDITVAVTNHGSELGSENVNSAIEKLKDEVNIVIVGEKYTDEFETYEANTDEEKADVIEKLFKEKKIDAAVTMHYPFPIGVSTVGKIIAPANGREVFLANTTGTSDIKREKAMILNAIDGIIAAKANGIENPTVGIMNVEGARLVEKKLQELNENGFEIKFAESKRSDKGAVLRGNDLIAGICDVYVTDSLTGNILAKTYSSFSTGGYYETVGAGYGPSIGENYDTPVFIVSRASGSPVIREAIRYAKNSIEGNIVEVTKEVYKKANNAGLKDILNSLDSKDKPKEEKEVKIPDKEIVSSAIGGVDILEIEDAITALHSEGIYAESAMGCTGPVVMINGAKKEKAKEILTNKGYI